jgi:hypothetical protein
LRRTAFHGELARGERIERLGLAIDVTAPDEILIVRPLEPAHLPRPALGTMRRPAEHPDDQLPAANRAA